VPEKLRKRLLAKQRDFRLLEEGERWSLWEAEYETDRPILALDGQANRWTVRNPRAGPVRLALAIRREAIATTPARHAAPGAIRVIDLADLSGFGDSNDARLVAHAQVGERKIRGEGLVLRGVKTTLRGSTDAPGGGAGAVFAADNTTNGAGWCTTGRKLDEMLDLSGAEALGFWVHGDGHGESLALLLCDSGGGRARFSVTLDFSGWRFKSFPLRGSVDWSRLEYLLLEISHIAPHAKVSAGVASIRAVPALHAPGAVRGLKITVNERTVQLPGPLEPNRCLTIDALGRATYWPGGMAAGRGLAMEGGALILAPGSNQVEIMLDPAEGFPGDLSVRACRMWPLAE
jgi:hypothetical protein